MGSIPPELGLDLRASFVPKTIGDFLGDVSAIGNVAERASKLEGFVERLEEEMRKIDAFKRELPLCMLLLNDAILYLKEESAKFELPKNAEPVLEEFMPLKDKDCEEKEEGLNCNNKKDKDFKDKKNWMSSVQLWNTDDDNNSTTDPKQNSKTQPKVNEERHGFESEDPFRGCRNRNVVGRAFVPFKPYPGFAAAARKGEKDEFSVPGLSLITPGIKTLKEDPVCIGNNRPNSSWAVSSSSSPLSNVRPNPRAGGSALQQAAARKQRRCWSPELHRRFVDALQQLGGSQVATPKQIREMMQVDGLTNDEVKSHLQKYRLHTRRLPSGSTAAAATSQSTVVLGSLWASRDQYGDSSKASSSQSGSPQGPFQLAPNRSGSPTIGDESMEDDEDAKSEGYSWKSHVHKPGRDDAYES